ncbi:helical backbone metal receptor [soil metagenome]
MGLSLRTPIEMTPPRIASLVPSITELLVALGLLDHLVARTGFCIHPRESLQSVPKIGGTKDVNLPKLRLLAPTHVIVNVDENRRETVDAIRAWGEGDGGPAPQIVVTHPQGPTDNLALIEQMVAHFGAVNGVPERAAVICRSLEEELALTQPAGLDPQLVLYLIWREPWMTVARDTYLSRMLARIGWYTLPDLTGGRTGAARYPQVNGDEPWLAAVQQVLLSSEPYSFDASHVASARALCPHARVRLVDGEMLSWYGVRAIEGLRYLRNLQI